MSVVLSEAASNPKAEYMDWTNFRSRRKEDITSVHTCETSLAIIPRDAALSMKARRTPVLDVSLSTISKP
jgi:hypothetical protein